MPVASPALPRTPPHSPPLVGMTVRANPVACPSLVVARCVLIRVQGSRATCRTRSSEPAR